MSYIGNQITGFLGTGSLTVTTSTVAVEGDALFSADGNVVLGDASGDTITINAATASIPNNLNIDSNTLFLNASNNRVGIGNASPATALDVAGTITSDGLTVDGTATEVKFTTTAGRMDLFLTDTDTTDGQVRVRGDANALSFITNTTLRQNIASNGDISLYEDTGTTAKLFWDASAEALGIGTTSPASMLDIKGSIGNSTITLNSAAAIDVYPSIGKLRFYSNDNSTNSSGEVGSIETIGIGTWNGASNNAAMTFNLIQGLAGTTSPVEALRIDSSGNVLVGTTDTNPSNNGASGDAGVAIGSIGYISAARSSESVGLFNRMDSDGSILLFRKDGATVGSIGSATKASDTNVYIGSNDVNLYFFDDDDSISAVNSSGSDRDNAVDIGRSSTRFKDLYLSGKSQADSYQFAQNSSATGATEAIYRATTGTIAVKTNSTERMRIDSSGNLLVGKTSSDLTTTGSEVQDGAMRIVASSTSTNLATNSGASLLLGNPSSTNGNFSNIGSYNTNQLVDSQINFIHESHSSRTGAIGFSTHNGSALSERMRITNNGITFNGDTAAANALDDYEEGTCSVSLLTTGSPNPTYTIVNSTAYYTKIGRLVTVNFYSGGINITSAGTGAARIAGLPFNATSTTYGQFSVVSVTHTTAFTSNVEGGITLGNSTQMAFYPEGSVSSMGFTTGNPLYIMFTVTYWTD